MDSVLKPSASCTAMNEEVTQVEEKQHEQKLHKRTARLRGDQPRRVSFDSSTWEHIEIPMTIEEREARMPFGCSPFDETGQEKPLCHVPESAKDDDLDVYVAPLPPTFFAQYWTQLRRSQSSVTDPDSKHLQCIVCDKGPEECECCIPDDRQVSLGHDSAADSSFKNPRNLLESAVRGLGQWTTFEQRDDEVENAPEVDSSMAQRFVGSVMDVLQGISGANRQSQAKQATVSKEATRESNHGTKLSAIRSAHGTSLFSSHSNSTSTNVSHADDNQLGAENSGSGWRIIALTGLAITAYALSRGSLPSLPWLSTPPQVPPPKSSTGAPAFAHTTAREIAHSMLD